jgi:GT2 family glycosyltransferase
MPPKVSIIILNWNGEDDTMECLESLAHIDYPNYNIVLVDNGSEEISLKKLKQYYLDMTKTKTNTKHDRPDKHQQKTLPQMVEYTRRGAENIKATEYSFSPPLTIIKNENNLGFAEGNNIGLRYAKKVFKPDFYLFLNNDTIVDEHFLTRLIDAAADHKIGILGPKIYDYHDPERICFAGGYINFWRGETPHYIANETDSIEDVDYIEGSCLLVKKEVIEKVGMFNKKLFAYWEDTDLCLRALEANYRIVFVPESMIWHKISSTAKKADRIDEYYYNRNKFYIMKKYANKKQFLSFIIYFFGFKIWFRSGTLLFYHKSLNGFIHLLKGTIAGITIKTKNED